MNDIEENVLRRTGGEHVAATYRRNDLMLEAKKLDDLFSLLKEMTRPGISYPKFARLLDMWDVLMYSLIMLIVLFMFPGPFAWQHGPGVTPSELDDVRLFAGQLFEGSCGFSFTILILTILYIAWNRKELGPYLNLSVKDTLHRDAEFIKELLLKFDKATLAYGLVKYRHRWSSEDDVLLFVGDLRKIGLFPAVAVLLISVIPVTILLKGDSNLSFSLLSLRDLVKIVVMFYALAAIAFLFRKRPRQVIELLGYAIQHADQCKATPPDAITSAPTV
jgi:hypothetical protein